MPYKKTSRKRKKVATKRKRPPTKTVAPQSDVTLYLQSLDSVRFKETDPVDALVVARVETFISLLFGHTVTLGDHQFIDSKGFLQTCYELSLSFEGLEKKDKERIFNVFPFRLGLRENWTTIDSFLADKLGDPGYKLSLYKGIGNQDDPDMVNRRKEIKEKIQKGTFQFEDDLSVPNADYDAFKQLRVARGFFLRGERGEAGTLFGGKLVTRVKATKILPNYLTLLSKMKDERLGPADLITNKLDKIGLKTDGFFTEETLQASNQLISALSELKARGVPFDNRSAVRLSSISREVINDDNLYDGILELFDSFYNTSSAISGGAESAVASVARDVNNIFVRAAEDLATFAKQISSGKKQSNDLVQKGSLRFPLWSQGLRFDVLRGTQEEETIAQIPWEIVWQAFQDPKWLKSVNRLTLALEEVESFLRTPTRNVAKYNDAVNDLRDAILTHTGIVASLVRDPAWKIEGGANGSFGVDYVSKVAGRVANVAVRLKYGQLTGDLTSPTAESLGEGADLFVEEATKKLLTTKKSLQGRYHNIFKEIYKEYL